MRVGGGIERGRGVRVSACLVVVVLMAVAAGCSDSPEDQLAALQAEVKMEPADFIAAEWANHLPEQHPGTEYLRNLIRSLSGARGMDAASRECAVTNIEKKIEAGKTLGDFSIGDVGSSTVKKGKLSTALQPCASAEVLDHDKSGTYVVAADLDLAVPRKVLIDGARGAATDVGLNDSERDCVMTKVYGALSDTDLALYFTSGVPNNASASKDAVKQCVTGDRVLPVALKAKQQAQTDEANRERERQLSQAAIDRAMTNLSSSVPSSMPASAPETTSGH